MEEEEEEEERLNRGKAGEEEARLALVLMRSVERIADGEIVAIVMRLKVCSVAYLRNE